MTRFLRTRPPAVLAGVAVGWATLGMAPLAGQAACDRPLPREGSRLSPGRPLPDGTFLPHHDASFDLLKIRFDGDSLLHRGVPYEPRPITRAEASLQRELMADRLARGGSPWDTSNPERKRRIGRELITFPDHYPPVRRIVAGEDGSIWLLREAWPAPADVWEIYGADGELEGSVRIEGVPGHEDWEPRLRIPRAIRTEVWATTRGEFGVPYVHRYGINRSCR